jgi:hypothetical protein
LDVLAFLKARLKSGAKRSAENRQKAAASLPDVAAQSNNGQPDEKSELEPARS